MVVFCVAAGDVIWIKHKRTRDLSTAMVSYCGSLWVFLHSVYIWQKCKTTEKHKHLFNIRKFIILPKLDELKSSKGVNFTKLIYVIGNLKKEKLEWGKVENRFYCEQ